MELIPLYLSHIEAEGHRPVTIVHYGETLRRFEAWLSAAHDLTLTDQNIERVSGLLLSEYVQMLYANGLKISTRNNYIIVLKEFFEFMNGAGVIRGNPSSVLHCVKDNDKKEMEVEEVDQKAYTPEEMLRCEAEQNPAFKQIIPYIILMNVDGRILLSKTLGARIIIAAGRSPVLASVCASQEPSSLFSLSRAKGS